MLDSVQPLKWPICRVGKLLEGDRGLSAAESYRIGDALVAEVGDYRTKISSSLKNFAGGEIQWTKESPARTDHYAPIISFPAVRFNVGAHKFESRQSVTVCHGVRRSKVWSRVNVLSPLNGASRDSAASRELMNAMSEYCDSLYSAAEAYYVGILGQLLSDVTLDEFYRFEIRGIDTADDRLRHSFYEIYARGDDSSRDIADARDSFVDVLKALYPQVVDVTLHRGPSKKQANGEGPQLLMNKTEHAWGLFASLIGDSSTLLFGVCGPNGYASPSKPDSRSLPQDNQGGAHESAARSVTREVLSYYAALF